LESHFSNPPESVEVAEDDDLPSLEDQTQVHDSFHPLRFILSCLRSLRKSLKWPCSYNLSPIDTMTFVDLEGLDLDCTGLDRWLAAEILDGL
jgi:hypothetical protein